MNYVCVGLLGWQDVPSTYVCACICGCAVLILTTLFTACMAQGAFI